MKKFTIKNFYDKIYDKIFMKKFYEKIKNIKKIL
jgi:hypothetical protein